MKNSTEITVSLAHTHKLFLSFCSNTVLAKYNQKSDSLLLQNLTMQLLILNQTVITSYSIHYTKLYEFTVVSIPLSATFNMSQVPVMLFSYNFV